MGRERVMIGTAAKELAASRMFLMAEDVEAIQQLVQALAPDVKVVDLGAGSGTTALAVLDVNQHAAIITVDIDQGAIHWAERNIEAYYPGAHWTWMVLDAAASATFIGPVDLVLHDASHEEEHVEADLRAWAAVCAPGTPLWVHDYAAPPVSWGQPDSPGVARAIAALIRDGLIEHVGTAGLGWYGRFR